MEHKLLVAAVAAVKDGDLDRLKELTETEGVDLKQHEVRWRGVESPGGRSH